MITICDMMDFADPEWIGSKRADEICREHGTTFSALLTDAMDDDTLGQGVVLLGGVFQVDARKLYAWLGY